MLFFKKPAIDWLIVGLGNPGRQYEQTRHNMGFCALDILARKLGCDVKKSRFRALVGTAEYHGQKLLLMQPQTFMNASGLAIEDARSFYRIEPSHILVLFDDVSLPVGKIRVRPNGSAGGHNGIKSTIFALKTDSFARIKIGVGEKPDPEYDLADWVLGKVPKSDLEKLEQALERAAQCALCVVDEGTQQAAAKFNGL